MCDTYRVKIRYVMRVPKQTNTNFKVITKFSMFFSSSFSHALYSSVHKFYTAESQTVN